MDYLISMLLQGMLLLVFLTVFITAEAEEMHGRHVCSHQQTVAVPVPIQQSYIRAVYKKDIQRTVYQTAYKTVFKMQIRSENVTGCCPGWEKRSPREANCMKPVCEEDCENEGQCVGPDLCVCGEGYTGYKCHIDIDECSGRNTCQQKCTNMPGSYECSCQDGFILAEDEYTCDLCISCTEEFQNLSSQVEFMKNFPRQNDISLEVNDNMNNMTLLVKQEEAIQNIYNQLANLNDTIVSTERFQNLQTQFDNIKETISKVDSIPELKARIDVLQESSLHTDKFLEIQNRIDDIAEVKEIVETVQTLNDTVHRLLEDGTKTEQLQELQKLVGDLVLSKAQQDEAQTSKFDEMNKELQQLREINVLQETVHEFKDEFQEVSGRVDQLIIDKEDYRSEVKVQAERVQGLQKEVDTLKDAINIVDNITEINTRIDVLQESSLHTDKFLEIQNRIDDIAEVKVIVEKVQTLNDTVHSLLEDSTHTEQLQEMKKQIADLVLSKVQQDEAQTSRFEEMNKQLEQLHEIRALIATVQDMKDQIQVMTTRIQVLEADKAEIKKNLTETYSQYEAVISAFHVKETDVEEHMTTDPYDTDPKMRLDRLVSLSEQISILEERMADCACTQDYSRG